MESDKAMDVEEIITERVGKLVENERAAINKELDRLKKLEKDMQAKEKELAKKEKAHKTDKGKIAGMEKDLKAKEEEIVKKEKMLEDRKEYLDKLKDSLTNLL